MIDPRFRLVSSLVVLVAMAVVLWPSTSDGLGRYGTFQMFMFFGLFFAWNAWSALREIRRRRRDR